MEKKETLESALAQAQGEMGLALKDKTNPFYKSNYADLTSCFGAIRECFSKYGLSISQTMRVKDGVTILVTHLMHKNGRRLNSEMALPPIADPQKLGSCITYYRRYMLCAIAGIATADDDDGNAAAKAVASMPPKISTVQQQQELQGLIFQSDDPNETLRKCLEWCQVDSIEVIPQDKILKLIKNLSKA